MVLVVVENISFIIYVVLCCIVDFNIILCFKIFERHFKLCFNLRYFINSSAN